MKGEIHVVHERHEWRVKSGGKSFGSHRTKAEAVAAARAIARERKTELVVHNMDGKIAWKNSYGNDPRPPRGSRG